MRIRKQQLNQYALANQAESDVWVRDFTQSNARPIDINNLYSKEDFSLFLRNELLNANKIIPMIDQDSFVHPNIVIVSDGFDFVEHQHLLAKFPKDKVTIIGVNRSLSKWKLVGEKCPPELKRSINWYVVNNPYTECIKFLPVKHRYFPRCIASVRTSPEFVRRYEGSIFSYLPTPSREYNGAFRYDSNSHFDDYRNSICAAISLAWKFKVRKLLLFCCDDSFVDERPLAERLENGLYSYPQQQLARHIIDANLYWLKEQNVKIGDFSKGIILEHAAYINVDKLLSFFDEEHDG